MSLIITIDAVPVTHDFAPSGLNVTHRADGEASAGGIPFEDPDGTLTIVGHRPVTVEEDACAQPRLFTGWVTQRDVGRAYDDALIVDDARIMDTTLVDLNSCLGWRQITGVDGNRPAETWATRLTWILGSDYLSDWISGDETWIVTNTVSIEAADYRGSYPSAVLDDLADRSGGAYIYFVFWDTVASEVRLFFDNDVEVIGDCSLSISNVIADVDYAAVFPPDNVARLAREPDGVYSDVTVVYDRGAKKLNRYRASTAAAYVRRGTEISRPYTRGLATATAQAEAWLTKHAVETDRITCTIRVPAASVGLAQAGQSIQARFPHLGTTYSVAGGATMRIVSCSPKPTDDTGHWYDLALELVYRPTAESVNPCGDDVTPSGFYPPLLSATSDATGNVQYWSSKPGGDPVNYYPEPFRLGSWWFPTFNQATTCYPGHVDGGVANDSGGWDQNHIRLAVVGPGTISLQLCGGTGDFIYGTLFHHVFGEEPDDAECLTNIEVEIDAPTVVVVPDDGYCFHYLDIGGAGGSGDDPNGWFAGFTWAGIADAPDEVTDLGPTPGATTTHTVDPTVDDDETLGYGTPGMIWVNTSTGDTFILVDGTDGSADWQEITGAGVTDHGLLTGLADDDHSAYETVTAGGGGTIKAHGATGAAETIAPADGNVHTLTLDADCTLTLTAPTNGVSCTLELYVSQDGTGGWALTWPGSVIWPGGTDPVPDTTASTVTRYVIETLDGGTNWYGVMVGGGGGTPATTITDETTWGITPAVGSDTEYARQDHTHGSPAQPVGTGELLITDTPAGSPLVFDDILQNDAGDALLYADA